MKYLTAIILSLTITVGYTQSTLKINASSFEKKWIKKGTTEMSCYTKSGNQFVPFGSFNINITENNGRLSVITVLKMLNSSNIWVDTSISETNTLKPVYRSSSTPDRRMVLQFGKEVNGFYFDNNTKKQTSIKETIQSDLFESYTYPYILAALPLTTGYKAVIPVYDYRNGISASIGSASIREVKSNIYKSDLTGEHKVWQLSVTEETTNDKYEYYIDKDTRRLWKIEVLSKGQNVLMVDKENDYNPFTAKLDKEKALAMIQSGKSVITGQAFARDNQNEGLLGGKAILNINKKQYASKGVAVLLIPYTDYFKEWVKLNESSRKKGKAIPLSKEAAECIKVTTVYDDKGSFEFVNLQAGEYLLYTEFGYVHTSNRTEVVGYTDTYINGMFQGSAANTETYKVQGNAAASIKKVIAIKTDGQTISIKLKKTL